MLLGAAGVLLSLRQLLLLGSSEATPWMNTLWSVTVALFSMGTAFYFSRPRDRWEDRLACPRCHSSQTLRRTVIGQPKISVPAWILGGFIGSVLYCHARKQRFRCDACQGISAVRTPGGRLAAAWLVLLILSLGLCA